MDRQITEMTSRLDKRIVVWWDDHKQTKFWEGNSWAVYGTSVREFEYALRSTKNAEGPTIRTMYYVGCKFNDPAITASSMHLDGSVPYRAYVGSFGSVDEPDRLVTEAKLLPVVLGVIEYLESDPLIDGIPLSRRRWMYVVEERRRTIAIEQAKAIARMEDPGFTKTQAKVLIDILRTRAAASGTGAVRVAGRDGTRRESYNYIIRGCHTTVGRGGSRVTFTRGDDEITHANLSVFLQEECSYEQSLKYMERAS